MVSKNPSSRPEGVPPAFGPRMPAAAQFLSMDDHQVLRIATAAFTAAQTLPVGSARIREWARFDEAMAELAARGMRHVLARLRERDEAARDTGDSPS